MASAFVLAGCSLFDVNTTSPKDRIRKAAPSRVFTADYDAIWRAAHTALKYTIAFENQETGRIETEYIRAVDGWTPPDTERDPGFGQKYKIIMQFTRGKVSSKPSVRVTVEKKIENQRDFFAESDTLDSDGLEEAVLFYRIRRELSIAAALKKAGL